MLRARCQVDHRIVREEPVKYESASDDRRARPCLTFDRQRAVAAWPLAAHRPRRLDRAHAARTGAQLYYAATVQYTVADAVFSRHPLLLSEPDAVRPTPIPPVWPDAGIPGKFSDSRECGCHLDLLCDCRHHLLAAL